MSSRLLSSTSRRAAVFLPTPGHQAQGGDVVLGQHPGQVGGAVHRQDGEGERRPDAVGAEQGREAAAGVGGGEAVQRLVVLADVVVDPDEDLVADVAEPTPRWWD